MHRYNLQSMNKDEIRAKTAGSHIDPKTILGLYYIGFVVFSLMSRIYNSRIYFPNDRKAYFRR